MADTKKPELLAPAGDLEALKTAVAYGADAVYIGGQSYGLRARAKNFGCAEMAEGIAYAHSRGVRVYVAANVCAHDSDMDGVLDFIAGVCSLGADALIVADPGVFALARERVHGVPIHISTQANTANARAAMFWRNLGATRVNLARELSMAEIAALRAQLVDSVELEAFVHGSMCMAVSGRCFLSLSMTGRDANQGTCAHPCRYRYRVEEVTREGYFMQIDAHEGGFAVFSADDLCMVSHIPELAAAGLSSFKIEGRMKSPFYVGTTVRTYRQAIDDFFADPALYRRRIPYYMGVLLKACRRGAAFSTGFYFGVPNAGVARPETNTSARAFLGVVSEYDKETRTAFIRQRNKFSVGDAVEVIRAGGGDFTQEVAALWDEEGNGIQAAPHPDQCVRMVMERPVSALDMVCEA